MGKRRYERVLDKVREEVALIKVAKPYPCVLPKELAEKLRVKEKAIVQACSVLQKEGVLHNWRSRNAYIVKMPPAPPISDWDWKRDEPPLPRKQKVSWGIKKRILTLIRTKKPWVIERWYETDQRWYMYMETGCERDLKHNTTGCTDSLSVDPQDQPDLSRTVIARWHFDLDEAVKTCARVRRQYPKFTFRVRDTSKGDYLMGAIL